MKNLVSVSRLLLITIYFIAGAGYCQSRPDALLSVDQNRASVIDRIMRDTGDAVARTQGWDAAQLREILNGLRADHLLSASLAGTSDGLRAVVAAAMVGPSPRKAPTKSLGDATDDVTYTPVTPCRLVDTRGTFAAVYQGDGPPSYSGTPFVANTIRTYTIQGANGVCLSQLSGVNPAAIQIQVFAIPVGSTSGDVEILPQGSTFGSTATMVFLAGMLINTVSTTAKVNMATNQIGIQVRGGAAHIAIDIVGYFRSPSNYGSSNTASGTWATVGGGSQNVASGGNSVVAGGFGNQATASYSAVAGGYFNGASGVGSFAAGMNNQAVGRGSVAIGAGAVAAFDGCLVFGDSIPAATVSCDAPNRAVMRATGGISMFTGGDAQANYTGVVLPPGGQAWVATSDRNGKENFVAIDSSTILARVAELPISTWNWKSQDASIRHIGPMAQDFAAAFGVGETVTGINTVDADGIALAAIQGLNAKLEHLIARQERELRRLRAEVSRLKKASQPAN